MAKIPKYGVHDGIKYNPKRTPFRICAYCGIPFFDIPPRSKKRYCSSTCYDDNNRETQRIKRNPIHNPINNPINNFMNNDIYNKKWNPINNPKNNPKRNRHEWANYWKNWYNSKSAEYKKDYNRRKKS